MSGLDTLTHTLTHTQYDYRNPRCACAPRVNEFAVVIVFLRISGSVMYWEDTKSSTTVS